jgi:hypothetical protein
MEKIIEILKKEGPLTGRELRDESGMDELSLWRECNKNDKILIKIFGERFLRLDSRVKGYARLSPSIKREFLTYTVLGLKEDSRRVTEKARSIHELIINISRQKFNLAGEIIKKIVESQEKPGIITEKACFIIAGDVVYMMAHAEPRPEASTGKMMNGSDLDIIIVTEDLPLKMKKSMDDSIYREKYYLLKNPSYREEIDYIIKDIRMVEKQSSFSTFKFMVASKILNEGKLLYGSRDIFDKIKNIISEKKIPGKIEKLGEEALRNRNDAVSYLLKKEGVLPEEDSVKLFYTKQEKEEIY